jgi:peptidoglycan/LPS O-acetylase OafA/YrhL
MWFYKGHNARLLASLRRSTSRSEFIPVVDGLRFLAIFLVVVHHFCERVMRIAEDKHRATASDYALVNLLPSGYLGVELFFVISGFIISYPFISAHFRGRPHPSVRDFYLRRVTRLEPPYFLVMIGSYLFTRLTGYIPEATFTFSHTPISLETSLAASLVYMHGILLGAAPKLNPPAWSLEIEIQFYIPASLVLLAVLKLRHLAAFVLGILTLIAGSIFVSHVLEARFATWDPLPLTKFLHLFLVGILINLVIYGGLVPQKISRAVWDIGFLIAIVILYIANNMATRYLLQQPKFPVTLCFFLQHSKARFLGAFSRYHGYSQ